MTHRDIPILKVKLPSAEKLLPYLREIDTTRSYANYGPLSQRLEGRLAAHFGSPEGSLALVANGTLALAVALMAQRPRPGTLCLVPAWTHIATVQAIRLCGLKPYFVDVDAATWAVEPALLKEALAE